MGTTCSSQTCVCVRVRVHTHARACAHVCMCTCVHVCVDQTSPLQVPSMSCMQYPTTLALCTLATTLHGVNTTPLTSGTPTMTASECCVCVCVCAHVCVCVYVCVHKSLNHNSLSCEQLHCTCITHTGLC